ncbi:MAG: hydroxymethylbilane synthase [Candidatus Omnitrophica bacterium]|nr:hydroxymethylbilane synthase [Candidatus Omnitrophota bacterium]
MRPFRLGARGSALSRFQARQVESALRALDPAQPVTFTTITAGADRNPDVPLTALGGEGVFVKELEAALLQDEIDAAVHSLKDVPTSLPDGLVIAAVLERADPRDGFISRNGLAFEALPAGARVGTSSPRRRSQLLAWRPELDYLDIRGNIDSRIRKLDEGRYDAIVLAVCGLSRLGYVDRLTHAFPLDRMLPEAGQGAVAIEARAADQATLRRVQPLDHAATRACVEAERAVLQALGGGCRVPVATYACEEQGRLTLRAAVFNAQGTQHVDGALDGPAADGADLGRRLAALLTARGADTLLRTT